MSSSKKRGEKMKIKSKIYTAEELIKELKSETLFEQAIAKKLIYVHPIPTLFVVTGEPRLTEELEKIGEQSYINPRKARERLETFVYGLPEEITMLEEIIDTCGIIVWYSSAAIKGKIKREKVMETKTDYVPGYDEMGRFVGYEPIYKEEEIEIERRVGGRRTYPEKYLHEISIYHKTPTKWNELEILDFFRDLMRIGLGALSDALKADYTNAEDWHGECKQSEIDRISDMRKSFQSLYLSEISRYPAAMTGRKACYFAAKYIPIEGGILRKDGDWEYYKPPGDVPYASGNILVRYTSEYLTVLRTHGLLK